jgi:hypothetical protein
LIVVIGGCSVDEEILELAACAKSHMTGIEMCRDGR